MKEIRLKGSGSVLRQAREESGLSLRELAHRLKWNDGTLSKYEKNRLGVSLEIVEQIADKLDYSREALVLRCLKERYRSLAKEGTPIGKLASSLIEALTEKSSMVSKSRSGGTLRASRR